MKIATTTEDFFGFLPKEDVSQAVRLIVQCGFRHIDISLANACFENAPMCSDGWEDWTMDILRTGKELGVDFVQSHASGAIYEHGPAREKRMDILKRQMRICQMLGIPTMVVHAVFAENISRDDFMKANVEMYSELLQTSEETGVKVLTENSCSSVCPTYYILEGKDFNELRERLGRHPMFGCCWDVGHANIENVDQYKCITDMGDGLMAVHIHDNDGKCDFHSQPYTGNTGYDAILNGLLDIDYKGYFTMEAYSIPIPGTFYYCQRKRFTQKGENCDRLYMLPMELKLKSEALLFDTARFMLETYNCYEE